MTEAERIDTAVIETLEELGRLRRRVGDDLKLLRDALEAARKGKTHVVVDHLERVVEALTREYERDGRGQGCC